MRNKDEYDARLNEITKYLVMDARKHWHTIKPKVWEEDFRRAISDAFAWGYHVPKRKRTQPK